MQTESLGAPMKKIKLETFPLNDLSQPEAIAIASLPETSLSVTSASVIAPIPWASNTMAAGNETSQITHFERLCFDYLTGSCTDKDLRCLRGFIAEFSHPNLLGECIKIQEGYKQANPGKESPFNLKEITSWYRSSV